MRTTLMSSTSDGNSGDLVLLQRGLAVAPCKFEDAKKAYSGTKKLTFLCADTLGIESSEGVSEVPSIQLVVSIVPVLHEVLTQARSNKRTIVICAEDPCALTRVALLFGCVMILVDNLSVTKVVGIFLPVSDRFTQFHGSSLSQHSQQDSRVKVMDIWNAVNRAKQLDWLRYSAGSTNNTGSFDEEQHAHYSCPLNGGICTIIPGKLVAFTTPSKLNDRDSGDWTDVPSTKQRFFGAQFFASLFGETDHFGSISLVMGMSKDNKENAHNLAPFAARGIATEDINLDTGHLLRTVDRLITVVAAAPGTVAIHTCPAAAGVGGRVGETVAALLVCHLRFEAESAIAWIHMVRAWRLLSGED